MPVKDTLHDTFVRALIKAGWSIFSEQFTIAIGNRRIWIDLHASKDSRLIHVEVKSFGYIPSPVEYLAAAIGQYVLYTAVLEYQNIDTLLYMAVPTVAYEGILNEEIGQRSLRKAAIKLIVFDPEREEITQWIA